MTRGKFNGYLELHLSSAMAMYYKYALDEKEKQCFLLQIWEGVWESLVKGMSNSVFVNHESTHTIHKLKTEYKWWFYYHRFRHYYSKDNRQPNDKIFFLLFTFEFFYTFLIILCKVKLELFKRHTQI